MPTADSADLSHLSAGNEAAAVDPMQDCLEACLARLPDAARALVLGYYVGDGQAKIDNRQRLADACGVSNTALRSRVHRLRDRLERCTQHCASTAGLRGLDEALRHVTALSDTLDRPTADGD